MRALFFLIIIVAYLILDKIGCFKESFTDVSVKNNNLSVVDSNEDNMEEFCKEIEKQVKVCNSSKNKEMIKKCNLSYLNVQKCRVYNNSKTGN